MKSEMYRWDGTNFVPYDGSVSVSAGTISISSVGISGGTVDKVSGTVGVSGTVPVSGTVGVSGTVPVQIVNNGTVSVSNYPATQPISGTVGVSGTVPVSIPGTPSILLSGTSLVETPAYTTVVSGELAIGTAAGGTVTGSIACKLVRFKARSANAGTVFIGGGTTVTVPDGTTDTTTGMGLIASDDTGWIPAANVNQFYFISSGTANAVTYLAVR